MEFRRAPGPSDATMVVIGGDPGSAARGAVLLAPGVPLFYRFTRPRTQA